MMIGAAIKDGKYSPNIVKTCRLYKDSFVYALEMKVSCSEENPDNVYIVNKELMAKTYEYVK